MCGSLSPSPNYLFVFCFLFFFPIYILPRNLMEECPLLAWLSPSSFVRVRILLQSADQSDCEIVGGFEDFRAVFFVL